MPEPMLEFKKIRIGFYFEVDAYGRDARDAIHRIENSLEIDVSSDTREGKELIFHHVPIGRVRKFTVLHAHEVVQ